MSIYINNFSLLVDCQYTQLAFTSNLGCLLLDLFQHVSSQSTHHQGNYIYALVHTVILQCYNIEFIIMICNMLSCMVLIKIFKNIKV
jgi:hypothetical protein